MLYVATDQHIKNQTDCCKQCGDMVLCADGSPRIWKKSERETDPNYYDSVDGECIDYYFYQEDLVSLNVKASAV